MKKCILFLTITIAALNGMAQKPLSTSNCDVTLQVAGESGTNGVAVAWNPLARVYYTVFAGNMAYPLETHTAEGASKATQEAGYDVRGMWYNPSKKCLEGIAYDNAGSFEVTLNADGSIAGSRETTFSYGMNGQSVATYAEKKKSVLFVEGTTAYFFKPGKTKSKTVELKPSSQSSSLNTSPIYTGVKNYEIGLLNTETMTLVLFSASSGKETGSVKLNAESCNGMTDYPYSFRVSYCNNRVFVFDTDSRTWTGYKLF